jgi:hypothetical protein
MLPPFIIEQIRKRESEERARPQPELELPMIPHRPPNRDGQAPKDEETKRGVIIVEL